MGGNKFALDFLADPVNYYLGPENRIEFYKFKEFELKDLTLFNIEEITFEDKAPRKEALENVISSLNVDGVNFIYLILGDKSGVRFYFGAVKDLYEDKRLDLSIYDIGTCILEPSLKGNFRGSTIKEVLAEQKKEVVDCIHSMKHFRFLEGVPGINKDDENFQGVDRLVDVMLGDEFGLMIIAKPLTQDEVAEMEKNLNNLYSGLMPFVKTSIQEGDSKGTGATHTITNGESVTKGENTSVTEQQGFGKNDSITQGKNKGTNRSTQKSNQNSASSTSETKGGSEGTSESKSFGNSTNESKSSSKGTSNSINSSKSEAQGTSTNESKSSSTTYEFINKGAQDWIKYLDDAIMPRLDYGKGKGVFVSAALLFTNNEGNLIKLENTVKSLYSGESGNKVPLKAFPLNKGLRLKALKKFQLPYGRWKDKVINNELFARSALSQSANAKNEVNLGNWISTKELSLVAGLPQKEIVGLRLREEVEFGLNFQKPQINANSIHIGHLVQSGNVLKDIDVFLNKENLNKHIFITGVTGSGKTTTCQKLLTDSELPFLVIEPAKTEYRILTEKYKDILIFTLGKDTVAPFRLNPFEFFPHESITSRVDMIKASIEASFDMEAAIPQIIEVAIYDCYKDLGWNIATNRNEKYKDPFADGVYAFPTLGNLIKKVDEVVKRQGFDERLKNDYIGSIKARLQGLLVGSKGLMLNTMRSVDFEQLLDKRVVLELEEIRSGSEKSLIMGFVLTNLVEAIKAKHQKCREFKHITLVEEAHRLLSKYMPGDSLNKKHGVEAITDMLAEVRKYGESLIIVDQIPNKLTSEVLKNTNTKIVHKIFAQDDKEAIGNTMALSDEQKNFLSSLEIGRAIISTQGWPKALQVQIKMTTNTTGDTIIMDEELRRNILEFYRQTYKRGIFHGLENFREVPTLGELEVYMELIRDGKLKDEYKEFFTNLELTASFQQVVKDMNSKYDVGFLAKYLAHEYYIEEEHFTLDKREKVIIEFLNEVMNGAEKSKLNKFDNKLSKIKN